MVIEIYNPEIPFKEATSRRMWPFAPRRFRSRDMKKIVSPETPTTKEVETEGFP